MKSKALISSLIVVSIVVGLVIMFTSGSSNTDLSKQVNVVEENKALVEKKSAVERGKSAEQEAVIVKSPTKVAKKPKSKTSSPSQVTTVTSEKSSTNRITRVSRPGQKFRMVRVETRSIPPHSELRKWSRNQWVNTVTALQSEGKDSLAQEYITAYNNQYPDKDLNNYLK